MIKRKALPNTGVHRLWPTALLLLVTVILSLTGRLDPFEDRFYDLFQLYEHKTPSDKIVLVSVNAPQDENNELWADTRFFELTDQLNAAGAQLIVATQPVR
ncbi:MAG: hypothetical protein ACR2P6_02455, partial [Gammaproteobacteria bacterium]